ncbi:MAG: DUF1957 domain-containing protein [Acidobacteriaceae bacterium]|nr:DUF1957 domain-containing protein [Acidobacteriaceae bacterium]
MSTSAVRPSAFLSLTLHAHLPFVVNHGTWPHGMEWLLEAAAETYLPLLRVFTRLEQEGIPLRCNLNLTPVLLEQLNHPAFKAEFPRYLERKISAAREDESYFLTMQQQQYAELARYWQHFFSEALEDFRALGGDFLSAFRGFHQRGQIEIMTSGATHGYMPLLGTDESVRAQIRVAVQTHERLLGERPRGIWLPECGYRPAGRWELPVPAADGSPLPPAAERIGIEEAVSEANLDYFFVDTHLVEGAADIDSPYFRSASAAHVRLPEGTDARRLYQPYFVDGPYTSAGNAEAAATIFPRDPRTGAQVWSGDTGYPGDENYLDFHKKRWPGGHRYWRVTGGNVDIGDKQIYVPQHAAERVQEHARHFVELVWSALSPTASTTKPPILSAPFDAELFGHWWFEGPAWLEAVARAVHAPTSGQNSGLALSTGSEYLDSYPRAGFLALAEGSWGAHGNNEVWLNNQTSWTYTELYPAELQLRELATDTAWHTNELAARILRQMCRELLLLESSDWQFLITTGAAQDYASARFRGHADSFNDLRRLYATALQSSLGEADTHLLTAIEARDNLFAEIDPAFWATGAHATRTSPATVHGEHPTLPPAGRKPPTGDATLSELPKFHTERSEA